MNQLSADHLANILIPIAPTLRAITPLRLVCKAWKKVIDDNSRLATSINAKRIIPLMNCPQKILMSALLIAEKKDQSALPVLSPVTLRNPDNQPAVVNWEGKAYFSDDKGNARVYDPETQKTKASVDSCRLVSQGGLPVGISVEEQNVLFYDLATKKVTQLIKGDVQAGDLIPCLAGDRLVLFSEKKQKLFLAKTTDTKYAELPFRAENLQNVRVIHDNKKLLFILNAPHIDAKQLVAVEYDLEQEKFTAHPLQHSPISDVYFRTLGIAKIVSDDLVAVFTNKRTWELLRSGVRVGPEGITSFHAQEDFLYTTDTKGLLSVYKLENLELVRAISMPSSDCVYMRKLDPEHAFTISSKGIVSLWNLSSGNRIKQLQIPPPSTKNCDQIAFQDGKLMVLTDALERNKKVKKVIIHPLTAFLS